MVVSQRTLNPNNLLSEHVTRYQVSLNLLTFENYRVRFVPCTFLMANTRTVTSVPTTLVSIYNSFRLVFKSKTDSIYNSIQMLFPEV